MLLEEQAVPEPGPGEVLVAMRACGICGSDLMTWYVEPRAPLVLGHEPVGVVVAAGEAVEAPLPAEGERVFVHHHVPCGTCELCRRGRDTLCETFKRTRIHPGGFSERILVPAENAARDLLVIPDGVSDAGATLVEPLACCVRGLRRARVGRGTRLLVIGGGQMGLLTALAGLAAGATVAVAEPLPDRRGLASALGAAGVEPDAEAVTAALGGRPTVVMLATGAAPAWDLALAAADKGAIVQLFAPSGPGERRGVRRRRRLLPRAGDPGQLLRRPARHPRRARPDHPRRDPRRPPRHPPLPARADRGGARRGPQPRGREGDRHERRMRAAVLHAPGDLRIDSVAEPAPERGEVVLSIRAALSCGTDVKSVLRGHPSIAAYPSRLGHEFAGVVHAVGPGVTTVAPGDRVFCGNSAPCGVCRPCTRGHESLCEDLLYLLGGFAEQVLIPPRIVERNLHRVPDGLDLQAAALAEPLACVVHALDVVALAPRRPRGGARRGLARADALRAARLCRRRADRARPPPRAARRRAQLRRGRDRSRQRAAQRTPSGCASSPRAAAPTSWSRRSAAPRPGSSPSRWPRRAAP